MSGTAARVCRPGPAHKAPLAIWRLGADRCVPLWDRDRSTRASGAQPRARGV